MSEDDLAGASKLRHELANAASAAMFAGAVLRQHLDRSDLSGARHGATILEARLAAVARLVEALPDRLDQRSSRDDCRSVCCGGS